MKKCTNMDALHLQVPTNTIIFHELEKKLGSLSFKLLKSISHLPWLINIIPLFVVGSFVTLILYLPLSISRRKKVRKLMFLNSYDLSKIDEEDDDTNQTLLLLHLHLEEEQKALDALINASKSFYVFQPLTNEFIKILEAVTTLKLKIENYCYPDYNKPLTLSEGRELLETLKQWEEEPQSA